MGCAELSVELYATSTFDVPRCGTAVTGATCVRTGGETITYGERGEEGRRDERRGKAGGGYDEGLACRMVYGHRACGGIGAQCRGPAQRGSGVRAARDHRAGLV